jgi:hypothetical protein
MSTTGNATVCHGIIEDFDITGIGESRQIVIGTWDFSIDYRYPINVLCDKHSPRSAHEFQFSKVR